jgi:hypothetical protein
MATKLKIEKKRGMKLKKIFSSETTEPIQFSRGATQGPFQQSLVAIGLVVSEEKIKM